MTAKGSTRTRRRRRRRPRRKQDIPPATAAVIATLVLFLARPHVLYLILGGIGVAAGTALAIILGGLATYTVGVIRKKYQPPARIIYDRGRLSVEFA